MAKEISRRDFLRIFPGLAAKKADAIKETIDEARGKKRPPKRKPRCAR